MLLKNHIVKLLAFAAKLSVLIAILFVYLFFEKFITEREITITVTSKAKFGDEVGKYLVFTPNEVFQNSDTFFYRKTRAEKLDKMLLTGGSYKVKVVGIYIPTFNRLRNITEVIEFGPNEASNSL